ncbi:hypothetical protein L1987_60646 [Smallanthus sonchifolius]|uniref:Uncharacterized protein n=1 Tax=Smallanthus sonchifolius TaxID=185202 RepID=A0ACB9D9F8_9ASTR|nr:hypothetical protein L1987_60646 [Smallanthus sonchifolius]
MGRSMIVEIDIPLPPRWERLWDTWDLRTIIILSLSLQMFLIFVAPSRKRTKNNWIIMSLWSAYLLADWAANFAIGLILNSRGKPSDSPGKSSKTPLESEELLAFWAPFLLVHLAGPDTITAFALEDNELWLRHLLGLVFQCVAAAYVFFRSLPHNGLWIPTSFMFLTGIMKYFERTRSLYLASTTRLKGSMLTEVDPGTNYAKLMDTFNFFKEAKLPSQIQKIPETDREDKSASKVKRGKLSDLEVVQYGYQFYQKFIGLYVDMHFSRKELNQSRHFFLNRTAEDAFKVVEVELNFIYEALFTKLPVVYCKFGGICRIFSLTTICLSIILFVFKSKTNFSDADVKVTYGLLFGALVLDTSALFMLLFSDWTIIFLRKWLDVELYTSLKTKILNALLKLAICWRSRTQDIKPRWSGSISTYNLINYCLHPRPKSWERVVNQLDISGIVDGIFFVEPKNFSENLRDFIFEELQSKSALADDMEIAKEISSARGELVLQGREGYWSSLLQYIVEVDYDQSLILWHIATDLCYDNDFNMNTNKREISKLLSDYMLYLLIMQPSMMSSVAGIGHIRSMETWAETCAGIKRIFEHVKESENKKKNQKARGIQFDLTHKQACLEILKVSTELKSLLFSSCKLAKELMEIEMKHPNLDKWVIISKVWVEMLCYAAGNSRANMQLAHVSKGGELITNVWLLMAHLGLGDQLQIKKPQTAIKLIAGK